MKWDRIDVKWFGWLKNPKLHFADMKNVRGASEAAVLWHVYVRQGIAYVPTVARAEAGFYLAIEPVAAVPATDVDAVQVAVQQAIGKGNPRIPTPSRATFPKSVILKEARVKSWSVFENGASLLTISRKGDRYKIQAGRKRPDAGWEPDPSQVELLPEGAGVEAVAERVSSAVKLLATGE
jgi:hypothetical protein